MTDGEKAIYAAVIARSYTESLICVRQMREVDEDGERDLMTSAAEEAWAVVATFREIGPRLVDGFGGDGDVYKMYREVRRGRR